MKDSQNTSMHLKNHMSDANGLSHIITRDAIHLNTPEKTVNIFIL